MASKRRNTFYENKKQEATGISAADDENYYNDDGDADEDEDSYESPDPGSYRILSSPQNFSVYPGETVRLPCKVSDPANAVTQWRRGTDPIWFDVTRQITDQRYNRMDNNTIEIKGVQISDTNTFSCQILADPPTQEIIHHLNVYSPAKIIRTIPDPTMPFVVRKGSPMTLMCEATGYPKPVITWTRKGMNMPTGEDSIQASSLTIDSVSKRHSGAYTCTARNSEATDKATVLVTVQYEPEIEIEKETVNSAEHYTSELECIVHANPAATVTWLKDDRTLKGLMNHILLSKIGENRHLLKISSTKMSDFGKYTCLAKNERGSANKSITLSGNPSIPVLDSVNINEEGRPQLTWKLESHAPITDYELLYRKQVSDDWFPVQPEPTNGSGNIFTLVYKFEGLEPNTYEARLRAKNKYGWSPLSEPKAFSGGNQ
ncbi:hypothetical protein AAG570_001106 [Ranatra chinensis]|uniref:Uncharacterized protein n=1 Tax=Ranatra chinensis TaxID=642074 RepID=A0ABD0YAW1_9HEMI